jgi:hypothetical protein
LNLYLLLLLLLLLFCFWFFFFFVILYNVSFSNYIEVKSFFSFRRINSNSSSNELVVCTSPKLWKTSILRCKEFNGWIWYVFVSFSNTTRNTLPSLQLIQFLLFYRINPFCLWSTRQVC